MHLYGRDIEAIDYYKKVIQIDPNYAEAYYNLGISIKALGRI